MKKLMYNKGRLYQVTRRIDRSYFEKDGGEDLDEVKFWRDWLRCEHVLKDNNSYIFVNEIKEAENGED